MIIIILIMKVTYLLKLQTIAMRIKQYIYQQEQHLFKAFLLNMGLQSMIMLRKSVTEDLEVQQGRNRVRIKKILHC